MYARASRRKARILNGAKDVESGPWIQVSRLGNPLINEVIIPMAEKDYWNSKRPSDDSQFANQVLASRAGRPAAGPLSRASSRTWRPTRRLAPTSRRS